MSTYSTRASEVGRDGNGGSTSSKPPRLQRPKISQSRISQLSIRPTGMEATTSIAIRVMDQIGAARVVQPLHNSKHSAGTRQRPRRGHSHDTGGGEYAR